MIGEDDWCVNYDKDNRMCKIYETRPEFCVVDPRKFKTMFGVEQEDLNVRHLHPHTCLALNSMHVLITILFSISLSVKCLTSS
jgi:Fe-S-cluster containining protein